jgi:hypothetical protein
MNDLTVLIREAAAEHPDAQPTDLARFVVKKTSDYDMAEFYEQALCALIPNVLRHERNAAVDHVIRREPNPSAKLEGIRSYWGDLLQSQIVTADGWKPMGDCTVDDFNYAIDMRAAKIAEIEGKVRDLTVLRDHMLKTGATHLRDAPEIVQ